MAADHTPTTADQTPTGPTSEPAWKLLLKTLLGMVLTLVFALPVLGAAVHLIDGGGSWWLTGHHLAAGSWYEAVRDCVAVVALTAAGGAAYLTYRRQRTADLTQRAGADAVRQTARANELAAQAHKIAADAQQTSAEALQVSNKQYELAREQYKQTVKQHDAETVRHLRARFTTTSEQLAHTAPAVRIAGVYAMAALADDWHIRANRAEVQVWIDVLCGYLRLPFGEDNEVRRTIVRVIAAHLRDNAEYHWSEYDFDFRAAHFEDADFDTAVFAKRCGFDGATFTGRAGFDGAKFTGAARFGGATFALSAWFREAKFAGNAWFGKAKFSVGTASYEKLEVSLGDARFDGATFTRDARFREATFTRDARFRKAKFTGAAEFGGAKFTRVAEFGEATFSGPAGFEGATFSAPPRSTALGGGVRRRRGSTGITTSR